MGSNKLIFALFAGSVVLVTIMVFACAQRSADSDEDQVKKGEYLVNLGACNQCHTPKRMTPEGLELDQSRLLSGHPTDGHASEYTASAITSDGWVTLCNFHLTEWAGPWGICFAANLTPDMATGIGSWNEDIFIEAMRTGRHMGVGRQIQLPMPWENLSRVTDEDLKAVFAYLRSLKPIVNRVPSPIPPDHAGKGSG
jgi:mono/diheme cytochrome c family protein